mmetsp:Transcript_15905/g.24527  ORF Transcript_15905/g.24527 Transcript_15905/m.24527 type:complete len:116 (-) Transcript_15905:3042-3389(-)|eukprot:CAMPEP_0170483994 /NCGR_PEP_ID=MMETSP0208-20121228/3548_1 /TAXON_ID=197538 /ORGANISM="Strombidium inclinatum, Strain S3" /LENGTH=115 /DNA_ID=CAMNT_0010757209 /DNA_START=1573 /DNA_END=1920 /DNA_ORIENTATION=+
MGASIDPQDPEEEEIEDDEVIVLEADNQDLIDQNMMQFFEGAAATDTGLQTAAIQNAEQKLGVNNQADLEGVCRICLNEEDEPQTNPLFSPCKCAGSMGLIHLVCLREWLKNKKI